MIFVVALSDNFLVQILMIFDDFFQFPLLIDEGLSPGLQFVE